MAGILSADMLGSVAFALASGEYGAELRKVVILDVIATVALAAAASLRANGAGSA